MGPSERSRFGFARFYQAILATGFRRRSTEVPYLIQQGVLSVEDADIAVCYGPGLRWGVMGPSLQSHVAGGPGGIQHFVKIFMDGFMGLMKKPEMPVTPALTQTVIDGVLKEANGQSVEQPACSGGEPSGSGTSHATCKGRQNTSIKHGRIRQRILLPPE